MDALHDVCGVGEAGLEGDGVGGGGGGAAALIELLRAALVHAAVAGGQAAVGLHRTQAVELAVEQLLLFRRRSWAALAGISVFLFPGTSALNPQHLALPFKPQVGQVQASDVLALRDWTIVGTRGGSSGRWLGSSVFFYLLLGEAEDPVLWVAATHLLNGNGRGGACLEKDTQLSTEIKIKIHTRTKLCFCLVTKSLNPSVISRQKDTVVQVRENGG